MGVSGLTGLARPPRRTDSGIGTGIFGWDAVTGWVAGIIVLVRWVASSPPVARSYRLPRLDGLSCWYFRSGAADAVDGVPHLFSCDRRLTWLIFGLITTFYVPLMDLFQTRRGSPPKTPFSSHVWFHGGLDILALCVLPLRAVHPAAPPHPPAGVRAGRARADARDYVVLSGHPVVGLPLLCSGRAAALQGFAVWGFLLARRTGESQPSREGASATHAADDGVGVPRPRGWASEP